MQIREDLTAAYGWPTIPQVFVKGELIGGADIVEEMERSGELEETLTAKLGDEYWERRGERTIVLSSGLIRRRRYAARTCRTLSACVSGFTFPIVFFSVPSASMTNVERMMPMYVFRSSSSRPRRRRLGDRVVGVGEQRERQVVLR